MYMSEYGYIQALMLTLLYIKNLDVILLFLFWENGKEQCIYGF